MEVNGTINFIACRLSSAEMSFSRRLVKFRGQKCIIDGSGVCLMQSKLNLALSEKEQVLQP